MAEGLYRPEFLVRQIGQAGTEIIVDGHVDAVPAQLGGHPVCHRSLGTVVQYGSPERESQLQMNLFRHIAGTAESLGAQPDTYLLKIHSVTADASTYARPRGQESGECGPGHSGLSGRIAA